MILEKRARDGREIRAMPDGSRETLNLELYGRVCRVRRKRGMAVHDCGAPVQHPLVGRRLRSFETGRVYNVQKVVRHWHWGWYFAVMLERNGSHGLRFWENISCSDESVLESIARNRNEYELVEEAQVA